MAENKKIRVSTLDEWHSALAEMYNALKNENANRYATDVGKDYESSSKLTSGAKATAAQINQLISGINALNGKDSEGNIPTDKDDLKVYFWYSDWNTPPGEITIGDTKVKIKSQLRDDINNTISELKQICVNNSKNKVPICIFDPETSYNKNICIDYTCPEQDCITYGTITHATTPDNGRTPYGTSFNSTKTTNTVDVPETKNSTVYHDTVISKKTKDGKTVKYKQEFAAKVKPEYKQSTYNINCNQFGQTATCPNHITNSNYYTKGKTTGNNIKRTGNAENTKNSPVTKKDSKDGITTYNQHPKDSKEGHRIVHSTQTLDATIVYSTTPRDGVTPYSTIIDYSKYLGYTDNARQIRDCDYCAPDCSQDIRCQTYNIGYAVKKNKDGPGYEEFTCSDTINLGRYLFIKK